MRLAARHCRLSVRNDLGKSVLQGRLHRLWLATGSLQSLQRKHWQQSEPLSAATHPDAHETRRSGVVNDECKRNERQGKYTRIPERQSCANRIKHATADHTATRQALTKSVLNPAHGSGRIIQVLTI